MKFKPTFFVICVTATAWATIPAHAEEDVLFFDSFESGNMSTTNASGFQWGHVNRTSIVTQSETDGNVIIYSPAGEEVYDIQNDGKDWTAFDEENSLRFRYPAGINWSEQRFDMGEAYPEIWISFWIRVPENYEHIDTESTDNGKWFALWMDDYSSKGNGPTIVGSLEIVRDNEGRATGSTDLQMTWSIGGYTVTTPRSSRVRLINYPSDQGRWMQWVIHAKAATTTESNDGIIATWRRWENESEFTKLDEVTNADIGAPSGGPNGWKQGYLMGYMNSPFNVDTEFLVDKFTISESCILESDCSGSPNLTPPNPPNPVEVK